MSVHGCKRNGHAMGGEGAKCRGLYTRENTCDMNMGTYSKRRRWWWLGNECGENGKEGLLVDLGIPSSRCSIPSSSDP